MITPNHQNRSGRSWSGAASAFSRQQILLLGVLLLAPGVQVCGQTSDRTPGTVVGWGAQVIPYVQPGTRFKAITAGGHSLALKNDGTVVAWGSNASGQSTVPAGLNSVVAIAAGGLHSLALKNDGTVVAWGYNESGQGAVKTGYEAVVAIAGGWFQQKAQKNVVTGVARGSDGYGKSAVTG